MSGPEPARPRAAGGRGVDARGATEGIGAPVNS